MKRRRRWWAQSGEDRIVAALFKRIGATNRVAVEFGALDGWHASNTAHFRQRGWTVHLFDAGPLDPMVLPIRITAENINAIFASVGVPPRFDLLSIDIDGNDLWVWRALRFQARVVIIEYNGRWGRKKGRTVPYDPDRLWDGTVYYGASARALVALGREKGYALYAATRSNLIFVQRGLAAVMPLVALKRVKKFKRPDPQERPWVAYP